ncbi:MAG: response regulator transcription factor [Syntrophomonadaceae bacterium]|nr:response regulator transcription factor [Syntrophomonadaceae bacterium]
MKIIIVDDDKLVCSALKTIIGTDPAIQVLGIGYSGKEAVALFADIQPDILLMDIRMDNMTGLEAGEMILTKHPGARILFLTTFADDEYIIQALKMGARGYLLKQNFESIVPSLQAVNTGQSVFGEDIVAKIPALIRNNKPDLGQYNISHKESEIITLIADGLSNKEIASRLFLSEGTVRNSISVILEKLQLKNRTQLAIFYYKNRAAQTAFYM